MVKLDCTLEKMNQCLSDVKNVTVSGHHKLASIQCQIARTKGKTL